ncbi:MAG: hypothetical protein BRC31_03800 [Actinobacteria bacterium QS_5_72_10]|nr:MAG: hypothetical protein BRC31_03800 [Actinobacteria bacterium QS_5_72_10]
MTPATTRSPGTCRSATGAAVTVPGTARLSTTTSPLPGPRLAASTLSSSPRRVRSVSSIAHWAEAMVVMPSRS